MERCWTVGNGKRGRKPYLFFDSSAVCAAAWCDGSGASGCTTSICVQDTVGLKVPPDPSFYNRDSVSSSVNIHKAHRVQRTPSLIPILFSLLVLEHVDDLQGYEIAVVLHDYQSSVSVQRRHSQRIRRKSLVGVVEWRRG